MNAFVKEIRHLKGLKAFHFKIKGQHQVDDICMRNLYKSLSWISMLREIVIVLESCRGIVTPESFYFLAKAFEKLKFLNSLKLGFFDCIRIPKDGSLELCESLRLLPSLRKLSLGLGNKNVHHNIDQNEDSMTGNTSLKTLFSSLAELRNFEAFELEISGKFFNQETLQIIGEGLLHLTDLKVLRLIILSVKWSTSEHWAKLLSAIYAKKNLKILHLSFKESKIDDSVLNGLEAYLKENKNIEQIALSILGCKNITDKGIKDLLNTLKHLKNLRAYKVWSREI